MGAKGDEVTCSGSHREQVAGPASVGLRSTGTLQRTSSQLLPGLALLCLPPTALPAVPPWGSQSGNLESGPLGLQRPSSPVLPLLCHPETNDQRGQRTAPIMYLAMSRMVSVSRKPSFRPDQLT